MEIESDRVAAPPKRRRWLKRGVLGGGVLFLAFAMLMTAMTWVPIGKRPTGDRLDRMQASPQWSGRKFVNPEPMWNDYSGMVREMFRSSEFADPQQALAFDSVPSGRFDDSPESGLRVTWLGHSTVLVEIDGARVLTDPVWGERTSPSSWLGPKRWYPPLVELDDLPEVDAVLISHDHYDHLDFPTIVGMADWDTRFVCPLGVGAHLEYWGVPAERVVELDWWEVFPVGGIEIHAVPSRHASGRQLLDQYRTLWAGFAMIGPDHRVLFSGDTGFFSAMRDIGERLGPFDVTMMEVGAYAQAWPDWHLGPEQAIEAHRIMGGELFLPIHWGLFNLAPHGWTEPIERVIVEADRLDVAVAIPLPGQSFEPSVSVPYERWWPDRPWRTADQYPIQAGGLTGDTR